MTQVLRKLVTFEEFAKWKPEDGRYELHDGVIVKMPQPLGGHEEVISCCAFLMHNSKAAMLKGRGFQ